MSVLRHRRRGPMKMKHVFVALFLSSATCVSVLARNNKQNVIPPSTVLEKIMYLHEQDTAENKAPPNFDKLVPTFVDCSVYVDSFDTISESSMDYTASLMLFLSWKEPKLKYTPEYEESIRMYNITSLEIDWNKMKSVWFPELYFPNEKEARLHDVMNKNQMMRLYPDGRIDYYARLSLTLSCPMNLRNYPFDKQECSLKIESFAYEKSKLVLRWSKPKHRSVVVSSEIELPQFQVVKSESDDCSNKDDDRNNKQLSRSGNYSCLVASFHLERNLQYYLIQMYIPSTLIVIVSWLSFWLNSNSVPGRVSLGVLTVLTMTTQSNSVNASLPRVSYIKAIDLWMSTCLVFVFSALVEFAIVNWLSRRDHREHRRLSLHPAGLAQPVPVPSPVLSLPPTPLTKELNGPTAGVGLTLGLGESMDTIDGASSQELDMEQGTLIKQTFVDMGGHTQLFGQTGPDEQNKSRGSCCSAVNAAILLDRFSRVLFPLVFAAFCAGYWGYYALMAPGSSLSLDLLDSSDTDSAGNETVVDFEDEK